MIFDRSIPAAENAFQATHARLLLDTYRALLKRELLPPCPPAEIGRALYEAPLAVLAHDTASDPVFFYGNRAAQRLFEMTWAELVRLPSRLSAEAVAREERQRLLDFVAQHGYSENYSGVRIAKSGRRFPIEGATVWNLTGETGAIVGQAAAFSAQFQPMTSRPLSLRQR